MRRFTLLAAVLVATASTALANAQSEDERIQMAVETRQGQSGESPVRRASHWRTFTPSGFRCTNATPILW